MTGSAAFESGPPWLLLCDPDDPTFALLAKGWGRVTRLGAFSRARFSCSFSTWTEVLPPRSPTFACGRGGALFVERFGHKAGRRKQIPARIGSTSCEWNRVISSSERRRLQPHAP